MSFYLQYLTKWSEFFLVQHDPNDTIMGYSTSHSHTHTVISTVSVWHAALMLCVEWQAWARPRALVRNGTATCLSSRSRPSSATLDSRESSWTASRASLWTCTSLYISDVVLGTMLFNLLSLLSDDFRYNGYFVDLFVRVSNAPAIAMYEKRGYSVYRRVLEYYSSETDSEDALGTKSNGLRAVQFVTLEPDLWNNDNICVDLMWTYVDMRKALSRDVNKKSIIPLPHPVTRDQL